MSEQNKAVVRRIIDEHWNNKNAAIVSELFASNVSRAFLTLGSNLRFFLFPSDWLSWHTGGTQNGGPKRPVRIRISEG